MFDTNSRCTQPYTPLGMFHLYADIGLSPDNDHMAPCIEHQTILCRRLCFQLKDKKKKMVKKKQQILMLYVYEWTNWVYQKGDKQNIIVHRYFHKFEGYLVKVLFSIL